MMSKGKKVEPKTFTSLDQLKTDLFPDMPIDAEELPAAEKEEDEADILANKLIDNLMTKVNKKD